MSLYFSYISCYDFSLLFVLFPNKNTNLVLSFEFRLGCLGAEQSSTDLFVFAARLH